MYSTPALASALLGCDYTVDSSVLLRGLGGNKLQWQIDCKTWEFPWNCIKAWKTMLQLQLCYWNLPAAYLVPEWGVAFGNCHSTCLCSKWCTRQQLGWTALNSTAQTAHGRHRHKQTRMADTQSEHNIVFIYHKIQLLWFFSKIKNIKNIFIVQRLYKIKNRPSLANGSQFANYSITF